MACKAVPRQKARSGFVFDDVRLVNSNAFSNFPARTQASARRKLASVSRSEFAFPPARKRSNLLIATSGSLSRIACAAANNSGGSTADHPTPDRNRMHAKEDKNRLGTGWEMKAKSIPHYLTKVK